MDLGDGIATSVFFICVTILVILFYGEPNLHDVLLDHIQSCH